MLPTADELKRMDARSRAQWSRRLSKMLGNGVVPQQAALALQLLGGVA